MICKVNILHRLTNFEKLVVYKYMKYSPNSQLLLLQSKVKYYTNVVVTGHLKTKTVPLYINILYRINSEIVLMHCFLTICFNRKSVLNQNQRRSTSILLKLLFIKKLFYNNIL